MLLFPPACFYRWKLSHGMRACSNWLIPVLSGANAQQINGGIPVGSILDHSIGLYKKKKGQL